MFGIAFADWLTDLYSVFIQKYQNSLSPCAHFADCIKTSYTPPLLKNIRTTMIDPDTDKQFYTKLAKDGQTKLQLVVCFEIDWGSASLTFAVL